MQKPIVVGCGAGFSADRLDPACALAESGRIACLVLECLGERTLAHGPGAGHDGAQDRVSRGR